MKFLLGALMGNIYREAAKFIEISRSDRPLLTTAIVLYTGVFLVVALYVATSGAPDGSLMENIHSEIGLENDRTMAEILGYGIAFLSSLLFLLAFVETGSPTILFLSVFTGFVWFDDSSGYHERFGQFLGKTFDLPRVPGLRVQDIGEVTAWSIAALVLSVVLLIAFYRRRIGDWGVFTIAAIGMAALVFCGMVVDLLHIMVPKAYENLFGVVEDGGEMLSVTYLAVVALSLARNAPRYYDTIRSDATVHGNNAARSEYPAAAADRRPQPL